MITSILDNDFYKFTMQKAVINLFPRAYARYEFINRGGTKFPDGFDIILKEAISELQTLKLKKEEKEFILSRCDFLDPAYLDFLAGYRFDASEVYASCIDGDLKVSIEGLWYRTILWEIPLMALISELFFQLTGQPILPENEIRRNADEKMQFYRSIGIRVSDFGTRRRYSYHNHDEIIQTLKKYSDDHTFLGTSNVHFAHKYDITPMGTQAHEWFMFHAAQYGFKMATMFSLEHWIDIYRGDLGIALADTFTSDLFFRYFDMKFAKLFDGVRHDSGDPIIFAEKTINHYKKLGIDPTTKTIVFSDSLIPDKVKEIRDFCHGKIRISFGIGTNFTNDVGVTPLNIVIKMSAAKPEGYNWVNTVKLSDADGKHTGDAEAIKLCQQVIAM
ncbi:MAG: nicotinate phosphoribosyltransferase [Bacteroidales bacterium]|nr:nicotinate phosphoribosyltransferase [Bacteroidales bacterium]